MGPRTRPQVISKCNYSFIISPLTHIYPALHLLVVSCQRFLSPLPPRADKHPQILPNLPPLSPPSVFQSLSPCVFIWFRGTFISVSFFFISGLLFTDPPHFLPFPVCVPRPPLDFQIHPSVSPSISSVCSDAVLSSRFSAILLFFSSLPSFICFLVHLFTGEAFWSLEVIVKLILLLLPFFLLHSMFFLSSFSFALCWVCLIFPPSSAFSSHIVRFLCLNCCSTVWSLFLGARASLL